MSRICPECQSANVAGSPMCEACGYQFKGSAERPIPWREIAVAAVLIAVVLIWMVMSK